MKKEEEVDEAIPGDLGQSLPPCGLEANVLSPGDLGQSLAPWRLEDNVPTPCGLGLKFTVGTAVSVSPLGQEVKRQRRIKQQSTRTKEEEEGETREDFFNFFIYIHPGYFNKNFDHSSAYFYDRKRTRREMTSVHFTSRAQVARYKSAHGPLS